MYSLHRNYHVNSAPRTRTRTAHAHAQRTSQFALTPPAPTVPPKITPFAFVRDLNVGDRTSIQCVVGTGDLPLHFVWLKDDVPIVSGAAAAAAGVDDHQQRPAADGGGGGGGPAAATSTITIRQYDDFTSTLSIVRVQRAQGGRYACRVRNDAAEAEHGAVLRVNGVQIDSTFRSVPRPDAQQQRQQQQQLDCLVFRTFLCDLSVLLGGVVATKWDKNHSCFFFVSRGFTMFAL